jgi:beta-glucosidase
MEGQEIVEAKCWGVEDLSLDQRVEKALLAGVDQFGGEACPEVVVQLVREGRISEERINVSIRRLLRDKFRLGLFDHPFVDPERAEEIVGAQSFKKSGEWAQRKSIVLLKNGLQENSSALPLMQGARIYLKNIHPEKAAEYGQVVEKPEEAQWAILRIKAPFEPRQGFLESRFRAGDLDFKGEETARILDILNRVPSIVVIYLDRPAVIPEIAEKSAALLAEFGAADEAILDVLFGRFHPSGKLPFELPCSMEAVRKQKEDLPYDSENPLFPFGQGLSY